jgi:hypothetical protein
MAFRDAISDIASVAGATPRLLSLRVNRGLLV